MSGYIYRTVPVALHAWLSHPRDYRDAVKTVIHCGGDTDTTAAIVGAIVGSAVGPAGIPPEWLAGLGEWPRSVAWMQRLASATAAGRPAPRASVAISLLRNALFFAVVLAHVSRRLLPPY